MDYISNIVGRVLTNEEYNYAITQLNRRGNNKKVLHIIAWEIDSNVKHPAELGPDIINEMEALSIRINDTLQDDVLNR
jgi:hypothetical protein